MDSWYLVRKVQAKLSLVLWLWLYRLAFSLVPLKKYWCSLLLFHYMLATVCCFSDNIIQFATDQLIEIGASGEQLSALIHRQYWAASLGRFLEAILAAMYFSKVSFLIAMAVSSLTCLLSIVLSHCCFRKWLKTTPMIANTLKSVFLIVNYARKTKYPRKRSALTYLDEEHPSRLDYGKDKFGGPFTEEEVEDVKTVLRMMPLFVCMLTCGISIDEWSLFVSHLQPSNGAAFLNVNCPLWMMTTLIPPLYQLVLLPTLLQCNSNHAAEIWNRNTACYYYCRFLYCSEYHWPCDESYGRVPDGEFIRNTCEQWMVLHSSNAPWNCYMYSGNVLPGVCDHSNTHENKGIDGGCVVYIQRYGKLF